MTRYFDSSFILSHILGQAPGASAEDLWRSSNRCLSSNLLVIECVIAIRRTASLVARRGAAGESWLDARLRALDRVLDGFDLKAVDGSVVEIVRETTLLAECRALDAIHLATALHFGPAVRDEFELVTLDRKMARLAQQLGLVAVP